MVSQLNNKEIQNKVLEIVNYIKETDTYKNYLKSKDLLSNDKEITSLIEKIKEYQKEIIKYPNKKDELEIKINKIFDILNTNPTYLEYLEYQDELNNMLTIFENKINKYFYDVFNQVVYE